MSMMTRMMVAEQTPQDCQHPCQQTAEPLLMEHGLLRCPLCEAVSAEWSYTRLGRPPQYAAILEPVLRCPRCRKVFALKSSGDVPGE